MKKNSKRLLAYFANVVGFIFAISFLYFLCDAINTNSKSSYLISCLFLINLITFEILYYSKVGRKRLKKDIPWIGGVITSLVVLFLHEMNYISYKNPIFWNWAIGILSLVFLVLAIVYYSKYLKFKDDNLKLQIEPHTIRNIIEDIRLKTKRIAKDVNNRVYVENEDNAIKSKINSLHYEMESTCDFLSEIAEDNSRGKNMNSIAEEFENVNRYLGFRTNNDLSNITIENHITKPKFEVPSRITTPIIENAFKHGDVDASDFLNVSFMQKDDNYIIEVRNRVVKTDLSLAKTTGLGINNLKQRVKLYNETQSSYTASLYNANKNDYYYFRIIFEKRE